MKFIVMVEVADNFTCLAGTASADGSLHEALCMGIYEGDILAVNWLVRNVSDIQVVGQIEETGE